MTLQPLADRSIRLRRPEYTGDNRCLPCTVVNLALAAGATAGVGLISPPAALAVAAGSLASIYFRGYLVPGTPELTKRYLPDSVLGVFGKAPRPVSASDVDPAVVLIGAGVVVDDPEAPDTSLDPAFGAAWTDRTGELLHGDEASAVGALAGVAEIPHEDLAVVSYGDAVAVFLDEERLGTWESAAAFCADVAGLELLAGRVPGWDRLGTDARSEVVGTLRLFVETCPDCGGRVSLGETTVTSCCSTREVIAATCGNCGTRLLELGVGAEQLSRGN
jgi:hypothetical protein